ncbi:MAG: hypothetical protein AAGI91_10330 [Bacteroidota bacterium]
MDRLYANQFLLTPSPSAVPEEWQTQPVGGQHLAHCPTIPIRNLTLNAGEHPHERGLLVGWTPGLLAAPDAPQAALSVRSEELGDLGGRWVFVHEAGVRLDPAGSFSVVYSAEHRTAASSPAVMPPDQLEADTNLERAIGLPEERAWYPFGLTPYRNVRRLLPGHLLPFDTFEPVRLPRSPSLVGDDNALLDCIAQRLREQALTLVAGCGLSIPLTAGVDTRMILASLRDHTESIWSFTFQAGSRPGLDVFTAGYLAERLGLDHHVLPRVRSDEVERRWFERTGRSVAAGSLRNAGATAQLPRDRVYLKGIAGELGRGFYYRPGDRPGMSLSVEEIVTRLRLPPHETVLSAGRHWLEGAQTEASDAFELLDMLYLENRLGCWAAPILLGNTVPPVSIWPQNQRTVLEAMRALSPETKRQQSAGLRVVERLWPDLLTVPINTPFGAFKREKRMKRIRQKVRRLTKRSRG